MPTTPANGTEQGRADPDVLVIGAGIVGLFCAYFLRQAGATVTVVERGPVAGPQSCSYGNTGFVGTQGSVPLAEPGAAAQMLRGLLDPAGPVSVRPRWDAELARWLWHFSRACNEQDARASYGVLLDMKKRSLEILRELCAAGSLAGSFTANGLLVACRTPQGFDRACAAVPGAVAAGVPLRILDRPALRALEPDADFDVCGAVYNEEGAGLHVPGFLTEFARMLAGTGVHICADTDVVGFEVAGGAIRKVRTTGGDFAPAETVIAAGAWSGECARKLDIRLLLQPARGYSITVKAPQGSPRRPVLLSEGKVALMPFGDRLRIAGTLELSGLNGAPSRRRPNAMMATVGAFLPRLDCTETIQTWSGLRPCTPDGLPFLGRARPYSNLSVACGHSHIGMGLAPASGRLIAQVLTGEQPDMDLAPLRIERYRPAAVRTRA